jgi:hypothetical protein
VSSLADAVKDRHSAALLATPGISAVGVETAAGGAPEILIHLDAGYEHLADSGPTELEGVPVRYVVDGPFFAQAAGRAVAKSRPSDQM